MSFDLGNWAEKLSCELCGSAPPIDLSVPADFYDDHGFPDNFWDEPPDPPDDFEFELPDWYPYLDFSDGVTFGIHGTF
jgi:hypothetical protein